MPMHGQGPSTYPSFYGHSANYIMQHFQDYRGVLMLIRERTDRRTDRIVVEIVVSQGIKLAFHEIGIGKLFLGVVAHFFRPVGTIAFHFRTNGKLVFIYGNLDAVLVHDCPNHALFTAVREHHVLIPLVGTASGFLEPCLDRLG